MTVTRVPKLFASQNLQRH